MGLLNSEDLRTQDSVFLILFRGNEEKRIVVYPNRKGYSRIYGTTKIWANTTHVDLNLSQSIEEGFSYGYWTLHDYVAQFKYIVTMKGATQVGGFGAIGNLFPSQWDWQGFWSSTALISIILAFMNILPIPALDGGHVMFLLYEMVSGRKPNDKFMEYAQMFGFFLLLALVLFANGNDVCWFFPNHFGEPNLEWHSTLFYIWYMLAKYICQKKIVLLSLSFFFLVTAQEKRVWTIL